jgi:hypothetical protein
MMKKREVKVGGGSERQYIFGGGQKTFPDLKVPRQCPLVLLVNVRLWEAKTLGSEFCYERMKDSEQGFHCV